MNGGLGIDEVAEITGLSVRTIRLYQTEGLVPAPERDGRSALYGPAHVARLQLIAELRDHGFGLGAIKRRLSEEVGEEELRALAAVARRTLAGAPPRVVTPDELGDEPLTPEVIAWALESGLYRAREDGMVEVVAPALHDAGLELSAMGVPAQLRRALAEGLVAHAEAIAVQQVETVFEQVIRPLLEPPDGPPRITEAAEALERLRPLAAKAVAGYMPIAMRKAIDALVERELGPRRLQ
jgi:DNA-binding transcriptional MerR regulator